MAWPGTAAAACDDLVLRRACRVDDERRSPSSSRSKAPGAPNTQLPEPMHTSRSISTSSHRSIVDARPEDDA